MLKSLETNSRWWLLSISNRNRNSSVSFGISWIFSLIFVIKKIFFNLTDQIVQFLRLFLPCQIIVSSPSLNPWWLSPHCVSAPCLSPRRISNSQSDAYLEFEVDLEWVFMSEYFSKYCTPTFTSNDQTAKQNLEQNNVDPPTYLYH